MPRIMLWLIKFLTHVHFHASDVCLDKIIQKSEITFVHIPNQSPLSILQSYWIIFWVIDKRSPGPSLPNSTTTHTISSTKSACLLHTPQRLTKEDPTTVIIVYHHKLSPSTSHTCPLVPQASHFTPPSPSSPAHSCHLGLAAWTHLYLHTHHRATVLHSRPATVLWEACRSSSWRGTWVTT